MQLILDNIAAAMIGGVVLIIVIAVMHRSQQAQVEAGSYYALKTQALGFINLLERDIQNADSVMSTRMDLSGAHPSFYFYSRFDSTSAIAKCVRYTVEPSQTRTVQDSTLQLYQIHRYQGPHMTGCSEFMLTSSGASPATITSWSIIAKNASDQPITDSLLLGETRAVGVRLSIWSPFKADPKSAIKETTWEITIRPPMLRAGDAVYL